MKQYYLYILACLMVASVACTKKVYESNGESIYRTGKNLQGERMLDRKASRIKIINSCRTCHGKNGDAMKQVSIKYSYLSSRNNFDTPYNDSLFFRFLDHDLKSDGSKANIGVIFKMSDRDKHHLWEYLKTL